jgi:hypothetical protein
MDQPFMYVYDFLYSGGITPTAYADLGRAYYASGVGQLYARSGWTADGDLDELHRRARTPSPTRTRIRGRFMLYKGDVDGLRRQRRLRTTACARSPRPTA